MHGVDAGFGGQGGGGGVVVAGEHGDVVAAGVQPGDDLGGFGAQFVADGDRADHAAVVLNKHGGGPGLLHALHVGGQRPGFQPAGAAQPHRAAVELAGQPGAGDRLHLGRGGDRLAVDGSEDRAGQGVFAAGFQRRGQLQHPLARGPVGGGDVDHGRLVAGQGAGLVQRHPPHAAEGL